MATRAKNLNGILISALLITAGTSQAAFCLADEQVTNVLTESAERIVLPGSDLTIRLWKGKLSDGTNGVLYAFEGSDGKLGPAVEQKPMIHTRAGTFDPLTGTRDVPSRLQADAEAEMFIVQFKTMPRVEYLNELMRLGAQMLPGHLADQARVVRMSPSVRSEVESQPWVRWVGPIEPEMKLGLDIDQAEVDKDGRLAIRIHIMPPSIDAQLRLADIVENGGGVVTRVAESGRFIDASASAMLLEAVLNSDDCIDIYKQSTGNLNSAQSREMSGADILEIASDFKGTGVRAEIFDTHLLLSNPVIGSVSNTPIVRDNPPPNPGPGCDNDHGTGTYSLLFAKTDPNGPFSAVAGMIPEGQGIFNNFKLTESMGGTYSRDCLTQSLSQLAMDPVVSSTVNYRTVLQSNSWGVSNFAHSYNDNGWTAEADRIAFSYDYLMSHGMGNTANAVGSSAIGKNILTAGALNNNGTAGNRDDDIIGIFGHGPVDVDNSQTLPVGRVKPDLVLNGQNVWTAGCNPSFGGGPDDIRVRTGNSFSTPVVAGSAGLVFEMWGRQYPLGSTTGKNIFRSTLPSVTGIPDTDVFANRPGPAVIKALLINTASPYDWNLDTDGNGVLDDPNNTITRDVQGWGLPDLVKLYDRAVWYQDSAIISPQCLFAVSNPPVMRIVPENKILLDDPNDPSASEAEYCFEVISTDTELRVSLVWSDPPPSNFTGGNPLVNNLDLKVTAPDGSTVYLGNYGLVEDGNPSTTHGIWSASGGMADTMNNVENVFIDGADLQVGMYTVQVVLEDLGADGHLPVWTQCSPAVPPAMSDDNVMDVKFALVISRGPCIADFNQDGLVDVDDYTAFSAALIADSPKADINHDGHVDFFDVQPFTAAFNMGCP
ncbi:hypothetical protein COB72_00990 [bacterium]|nr:MAG: hypothetical protein COB72_00990 [bacterium]